jgi:hypothetical protein
MYICFESILFDRNTVTAIWGSVSQSKLTAAVDVKYNSAHYVSNNPLSVIEIYAIIIPTNAYKTIEISSSTQ